MKKQILLGMALGALLLSVIAAVIDSRSMNSDQFNTTGNRLSIKDGVKLTNQQTGVIKDDAGVTRIIQIAGGSSGLNDGFGVNRVQIDAGGVIKLKATNAAQLFQLTADGYGEASFPWTFDNGILVGGNTNNSLWLFNPKNGLYRNFLFTDSNGDTQMDPDNDLHINSANNFIDGSLDLLGPVHTTNSSIFYAEIGLGISAPTHKLHIVSTSNDVVGIDSTGVDSASMLHIQNTGVQGPFFDIHSVSQRWGMGVGTNGNYELRRSPVGTDPVNGTTVLTIDSNSVATFGGNIIGNGGGLTNIQHGNTVSGVSGVTVALSQNPDGSTNFGLTATGSGSPFGGDGTIQWSLGGAFYSTNRLMWDRTNNLLLVRGQIVAGTNGNINASGDASILVNRGLDDTGSGNAHGFGDSSIITRTGGIAYNSYDSVMVFSNAFFNHMVSFQHRPTFKSVYLTNEYGLWIAPSLDSNSTNFNQYGVYIDGSIGAGSVSNWYGINVTAIPSVMAGGSAFGIFIPGSGTSGSNFFGGGTGFGGKATAAEFRATDVTVTGATGSQMVFLNSSKNLISMPYTGTFATGVMSNSPTIGNLSVVSNLTIVSIFTDANTPKDGTNFVQYAGTITMTNGATAYQMTNASVTANAVIQLTVASNDSTCKSCAYTAQSGYFTIIPNAAPTANCKVAYWMAKP